MLTRRSLTTGITLVVLVGVVVVGAVFGWRWLFSDVGSGTATPSTTASPAPTCSPRSIRAGHRLKSNQVEVSVFNAGSRSGLAGQTLKRLGKRGFTKGKAGNAPSGTKVRHVQVWSTRRHDPRARLVARQVGKKKVRFSDTDLGPGIDVVVGNHFKGLVRARRSIKVPTKESVCVPTGSSPAGSSSAGSGESAAE